MLTITRLPEVSEAESLRSAQALLRDRGLHKESFLDPEGTGSVCAFGALILVVTGGRTVQSKGHVVAVWPEDRIDRQRLMSLRRHVERAMWQLRGVRSVSLTKANDRPDTTLADVLAWYDRAIELAEAQTVHEAAA